MTFLGGSQHDDNNFMQVKFVRRCPSKKLRIGIVFYSIIPLFHTHQEAYLYFHQFCWMFRRRKHWWCPRNLWCHESRLPAVRFHFLANHASFHIDRFYTSAKKIDSVLVSTCDSFGAGQMTPVGYKAFLLFPHSVKGSPFCSFPTLKGPTPTFCIRFLISAISPFATNLFK